ncbi:MAG: transaldolase family protein [Candidatus Hadarchaeaceae archaeon]
MKIFVDTAKLSEIKEALSWGIVDGVTTNPSLIRKAVEEEREVKGKVNLEVYVGKICRAAGKGRPVSLEVLSQKASRMVEEAQILYRRFNPIAGNVLIKIPINTYTGQEVTDYEGLKAINELRRKRIPTNATLVMTPEQALLAAKAGATYVSPFAGRVDDYMRKNLGIDFKKNDYFDFGLMREISKARLGEYLKNPTAEEIPSLYLDEKIKKAIAVGEDKGITSGVDLVRKIVNIFRKYNIKTKVISASMRNPQQVREVAETGCDIATIPFEVIREMLKHPKTEEGVKRFYADAVQAKYQELFMKS